VEISSYVKALDSGLERLHTSPVSLRLIREIHEVLLTGTRSSDKMPGEFRRFQNWIGGTRPGNAHFVPLGADQISEALDSFKKFMAHDDDLPILVKTAMLHYQFETIHAFLDGNGRVAYHPIPDSARILAYSLSLSEPILQKASLSVVRIPGHCPLCRRLGSLDQFLPGNSRGC
jgi:fido (protein-threonine AMPylation protein)